MAVTQNTYTGNGATVLYSFTFPYLDTADIKVSVNGTPTTAYTLANATTISFNTAPANGAAIRIYRDTDDAALSATFYPGSAIRSQDLNDNFTQNLYVVQEINNNAVQIDGSQTMVGDLDLGGYKVVNSATATNGSDLTNKTYVDDRVSSAVVAGNPTFLQNGVNAVARSWSSKLKEVVSVNDFGAVGDGVTDNFSAVLAAWDYAILSGKDLYFPEGTYVVSGERSFPIGRVNGLPPTSMLDCKNITVYGDGPATILKTISVAGADVLQLNGAKNLHIRDLAITATLTGSSGAGSNGISITGGAENLSFTRIQASNLPYVEKPTYLDGGKAFSLQLSGFTGPAITVGTITFTDCLAKGCVYGFDHNPVLDDFVGRAANISFNNCTAEDCWYGFIMSTAASGVALPEGFNSGISFADIRSINCQHSATLARNHGGIFKFFFKNTKAQAGLKLNPSGIAWSTTLSTTVDGLTCLYAHNSKITANGYLNSVEYKARIGGTAAGSSGLIGATFNCDINIDLGGTATVADIQAVDVGGNTLKESTLIVSATTTASTLPADFYLPVNLNHVEHVSSTLFVPTTNIAVASLKFPSTFTNSVDVNTLDDYEEGTWTPLLFDFSLTSEGATYSINTGKYTKIGDVVLFNLYLAMSGLGSLTTSNTAFIGGLPFTSRLQTGNISSVTVGYADSLALSSAATLNARIGANENYITLSKWTATSTTGSTPLTVGEVSASGTLVLSGFYFT